MSKSSRLFSARTILFVCAVIVAVHVHRFLTGGMRRKNKDAIRIWWHCLTHLHRMASYDDWEDANEYWCDTCGYR